METISYYWDEGLIRRNLKEHLRKLCKDAKTLEIAGKPYYKISVTDLYELNNIEEAFDEIFHFAVTKSPPQFDDDPFSEFQINASGTLNIPEFAK